MRSMEFSGRTVDEAIFHGMNEMGLGIDEVEIVTVQTQSKGIFGIGAKNAIVRLTELEVKATPVFEKVERAERAPRERNDRPRRDNRDNRSNDRRAPRSFDGEERFEREPETEAEQYDYSAELAESLESAKFLKELLKRMEIEAEVTACQTDDGIRLNIISKTDGLLIGRRGETLDALQYLVSLYVNKDRKDEGYQRITLDTEGYRARREATLRRMARKTAIRVSKMGRSISMDPMNPYERRVIHASLKDFIGVSTHSEGEEPNRRVVITPNK